MKTDIFLENAKHHFFKQPDQHKTTVLMNYSKEELGLTIRDGLKAISLSDLTNAGNSNFFLWYLLNYIINPIGQTDNTFSLPKTSLMLEKHLENLEENTETAILQASKRILDNSQETFVTISTSDVNLLVGPFDYLLNSYQKIEWINIYSSHISLKLESMSRPQLMKDIDILSFNDKIAILKILETVNSGNNKM